MQSVESASPSVLQYLADYSSNYKETHFDVRLREVGISPDEILVAPPKDFLRFAYRHYAFNRAGGAAAGYNTIAVDAVDTVGEIAPDQLWREFKDTCSAQGKGLNARINRGAVRDVASLVDEKGNLFAWIGETVEQTGSLEEVYEQVNDIRGFGEKITRFLVRDAVWVSGVEEAVPVGHRPYLQPLDIWTRRVAHLLWERTWTDTDEEIAQEIAAACTEADVSGVEFNMGAWFCGAKHHDGDSKAVVADLLSR